MMFFQFREMERSFCDNSSCAVLHLTCGTCFEFANSRISLRERDEVTLQGKERILRAVEKEAVTSLRSDFQKTNKEGPQ